MYIYICIYICIYIYVYIYVYCFCFISTWLHPKFVPPPNFARLLFFLLCRLHLCQGIGRGSLRCRGWCLGWLVGLKGWKLWYCWWFRNPNQLRLIKVVEIPLFARLYTSQVVQDFSHQQYFCWWLFYISFLVGGWTSPFQTYARQNGFIFPKVRGGNKKYLSCHHLVFITQRF